MLDKGALHWQRCWPTLKAAALRFLAPTQLARAAGVDGAVETGWGFLPRSWDWRLRCHPPWCLPRKGGKLHQLWRCGKSENPKNCQIKFYFQLKHQLWPTASWRRTSIAVSYAALMTLMATVHGHGLMGKSSTSTACWSCFKSTDSVVTFTSAWQSTQGLRVNHVVPRLLRDLTDRLHRTDRTIQLHEDRVVGLSTCQRVRLEMLVLQESSCAYH